MYKDFKENYIEQQKQQAAARQARLAKIGMGSSVANAKRAKPEPEARTPQTQSAPRRIPAQSVPQRPVIRQTVQTVGAASQKPAPAERPATQSRVPAQRPAASTTAGVQRITQTAQRPASAAAQPKRAAEVHRPEAVAKSPAPQRPAQSSTRPVQSAHPASPTVHYTRPSAGTSSARPAGAAYQQRRKVATTEEEIFKKELSDSESRAMMFALTGKAEKPDDGGDVDIINMGRISAPKKKKEAAKKKLGVGKYIGRFFISLVSLLLFVVIAVFSTVGIVAIGPSETVRDLLVLSAEHSSAAKWVPYLFLPSETVHEIINKSEEVVQDVVSLDDYNADNDSQLDEDEWAKAKDGMIFETVSGSTFKAYVLLVKDPERVFVGTSEESLAGKPSGDDIFHITKFYGAVAAINGGEFPDNGGGGTGHTPIGLTYSKGECVYNDGHTDRTFLGITHDNKLVVNEGMTEKRADELGIRDAVSFQKGNTLIQHEGDELIFHYQDGNTGTAQRTGIGQRADGTMILVVTDGRSASSLGATHNDMIDLMVSYGAVTAGLLDGGSSAMMYYEDYYTKYGYDTSKLDEYQKMGLVNNYKAFTEPRKIPTFFIVKPE